MNTIQVITKIPEEDYLKLLFRQFYKKPVFIVLLIIGFIQLLLSLLHFTNIFNEQPYTNLLIGFLIIVIIPILIYRNAIKNYKSNRRLNETIIYEFDLEQIRIKGESFKSEMDWKKIHKLKETKDFILIYHNKTVANIILKKDFKNNDLLRFKEMVKNMSFLETKLK